MALPSTGAISFSQMATEFNKTAPHSISEFYGTISSVLSGNPISASNMHGAMYGDALAVNLLYERREFDANGNLTATGDNSFYYPESGFWLGSDHLRQAGTLYPSGTYQDYNLAGGSLNVTHMGASWSLWDILGIKVNSNPAGKAVAIFAYNPDPTKVNNSSTGWSSMTIEGSAQYPWDGITFGNTTATLYRADADSFTFDTRSANFTYPHRLSVWVWNNQYWSTTQNNPTVETFFHIIKDAYSIAASQGSGYSPSNGGGLMGSGKYFNLTFS